MDDFPGKWRKIRRFAQARGGNLGRIFFVKNEELREEFAIYTRFLSLFVLNQTGFLGTEFGLENGPKNPIFTNLTNL